MPFEMLTSHYLVVFQLFYLSSASEDKDDYRNGPPKFQLSSLLSNVIDVNKRIVGSKHSLRVEDMEVAQGYMRSQPEGELQELDVDIYVLDPNYIGDNLAQNENSKLIELAKHKLNKYHSDLDTSISSHSSDEPTQQFAPTLYKEDDFNQEILPAFYSEEEINHNVLRKWKSVRKGAIKSCKKACSKGAKRACKEYKCKKGLKKQFKKDCQSACKREFSEGSSRDDDDYSSEGGCSDDYMRIGTVCDDVKDDKDEDDDDDDDDK